VAKGLLYISPLHYPSLSPDLKPRERAEQMGARFIDAREIPWLTCSCGEVLVFVEDAAAGVM
jgi:hypothetical protein